MKTETTYEQWISLRDYFAAHAPNTPDEWFHPVYPPSPELPDGAGWCEGCKGDSDCDGSSACGLMREYLFQMNAWREECRKVHLIQWRWAWADAMLAAREGQPWGCNRCD